MNPIGDALLPATKDVDRRTLLRLVARILDAATGDPLAGSEEERQARRAALPAERGLAEDAIGDGHHGGHGRLIVHINVDRDDIATEKAGPGVKPPGPPSGNVGVLILGAELGKALPTSEQDALPGGRVVGVMGEDRACCPPATNEGLGDVARENSGNA